MVVDTKARRLVSNESSEIVRNLNTVQLPGASDVDLVPRHLEAEIDQLNDLVYNQVCSPSFSFIFSTMCCRQACTLAHMSASAACCLMHRCALEIMQLPPLGIAAPVKVLSLVANCNHHLMLYHIYSKHIECYHVYGKLCNIYTYYVFIYTTSAFGCLHWQTSAGCCRTASSHR